MPAQSKQSCLGRHKGKIAILGTAIIAVVPFVIFILLMAISWIKLGSVPDENFPIGAADTVTSIGCYSQDTVKDAEITTEDNTDMTVYRIEESKLASTIITGVLPEKLIGHFESSNTIHVNYYGNNNPLYVASNGSIMLMISVKITEIQDCAVKLLLFDDYVEYMKLFAGDEFKPPVNETCLNMTETKQNFTVNFPLPTQGSYYIGGMVVAGVTMNISGNGTITSYNTSQLHIQDGCVSVHSCEVPITTKLIPNSSDNTCVLVNSDTANTHVTISVNKVNINVESLIYIILTIVSFCSSIVTIVLLYFYKKYKNRNNQPNYSELIEHDDNIPAGYQSSKVEENRNNPPPIEQNYSKPIAEQSTLAHDDNKKPDDQATDTTLSSCPYEKSDHQAEGKELFDSSHVVTERRSILRSTEEPGNNHKETSTNTPSD